MAMGKSNSSTEHDGDVNEEANPTGTSVEDFFAASVVFITGVTGFLGKALLEKLLRACPRISTIYVLMGPKKNKSPEERLQLLIEDPVYDRIKLECPRAFTKVIPILGDVSQPDLGINKEDKLTLIRRVNIVFHSAATVRFDEPLKVAANLNTRGTERMIELCASMINLVSFIHVSTAYSNAFVPTTPHSLCDGNWHNIRAIKQKNAVFLSVDHTAAPVGVSKDITAGVLSKHPIFIGGHPLLGKRLRGSTSHAQYVGCIRNIIINGQEIHANPERTYGHVTTGVCPTI